MALKDEIANLPTTVDEGNAGHLNNHQVLHAAAKSHETRLNTLDLRVPVGAIAGTGTPEGRIAATVGTTYTDTAATNGAIRWIKASGTDNTGWKVEYGDTGWRDVTALFSDVVESGTLRFRRVGDVVHVEAAWLKLKGAGTTELFLPQGFTPSRATALPLYSSSGEATPASIFRVAFTGRVSVYVMDDRFSGNDTGIIYTEDSWPSVLPGTPA